MAQRAISYWFSPFAESHTVLAMRWEKKTEQVRVSLSVSDVELIDQYAERKRILTRPEAIRRLLHEGLIAVGSLPADE